MNTLILLAVVLALAVGIPFVVDRAKGFNDPTNMSDQDILSAIAGQADWLEKQLRHSLKFGGAEPRPELAAKRREYIYRLCETLISRHPEPKHLLYHATKRAAQLEAEGKPHKASVVIGVKERLFAESGYTYMAKWHQ